MIRNCEFFVDGKINPDYEAVKHFLAVRPYPVDAEGVEGAIHKTVGDIALVLYAVLWEDEQRCTGTKVPAGMEEIWGVELDTLFDDAFERVDPRVMELDDFLLDPTGYKGTSLDDWEGNGSFCLTTVEKLNGSVAIFKPGVAERIEGAIGPFWLAFTSIHEVMIHPVTEVDADVLRIVMGGTIDHCVREDEVLTRRLYRYEKGTFRIWGE